MPTRRTAIASALAMLAAPALPGSSNAFAAAIRRARLADAAHIQAGRDSLDVFGPNAPRPAYWRAYRLGVMAERYSARRALHALTPATASEAAALVAYHADRAASTDDPGAVKAARRRLRKVFARPGAAPMPELPAVLKPPAPS